MTLLFWPCMIASLFLAILAIGTKKAKLLVISSILILPLALYLAATPRFHVWGLVFPILFLVSAKLLTKSSIGLAILFAVPNFVLIGWIGVTVLTQ